ncbi:nucleotidyltransferase family protein [uncultured Parabacteroides sp.]|uniref:nucleotidyltransferase family protein n=2 Tax=uncultured Parabacteroides sp. TaxID=512312 RepID=UPI0026588545|nr:nucleotidyltransferase domain-containing protein [uncultured Parabacteroides sp.]
METTPVQVNKNIQKILPKVRQYLSGQPVLRAWLFGSYSRGEETSDSDIDILVQYKDAENISLFTISRIMCSLSKLLNRLVEEDGLLSFATDSVFHDRILIYEREN